MRWARVGVSAAATPPDAETAARSVARSNLFKTAIHGEDPNWGRVLAAVWAQERDISNAATLAELLTECGLPAARAQEAAAPEVQTVYEGYTQQAIDAGVFGPPSYVEQGEVFWGQDRLDFVQRRLTSAP